MIAATRRAGAGLLLALVLAACGSSPTPEGGDTGAAAPSFEAFTYTADAGARDYKVFVPAGFHAGMPLIVDLHGCTSDADEEARWSRFRDYAGDYGFVVAYPIQDPAANGGHCWNWFEPDHQARDAGEPALIAGITREVTARYAIDPRRVYVGGISAGGAMADVMAATYPDLYAAALVYAGCEYKGTSCAGAVAALPPEVSGQLAYEASDGRGRVVPVIVVQGDIDNVVPAPNAELVVQQFLAMDDWADNDANDGSIPRTVTRTTHGTSPGGQSYEIDDYEAADGCLLAQRWLVHGMWHQWSGTPSDGSERDLLFTDPAGPDVTRPVIEFFLDHPMPDTPGCAQQP